jgi:ribosome recycling factor
MAIDDLIQDATRRMNKSVEAAQTEFSTLRTGRASPALLDRVQIDYYGQQTPLNQLAGFQVPEPRTVIIQPYDAGAKPAIEKAIRESDLGVNPSDDGKVLRVTLPELTEDRRKEYIKLAKSKAEDGRIAVRGVRRNAKQAMDKAEKDSEISKDDNTGAEKRLDALTKKHVEAIDEMLKNKEAELLEV